MKADITKIAPYAGPSMWFTLKPGDILFIVPPDAINTIKPGDVIVFNSPQKPGEIVHRVVRIGPRGIITKGDNNWQVDPELLKPEQILGRVSYVRRRGKTVPVLGGRPGQVVALAGFICCLTKRLLPGFCREYLKRLFRGFAHEN